ncbi:MAG: PorP/SprF family type IX secretion system membrane protein [Flavobacteriales bacterium]
MKRNTTLAFVLLAMGSIFSQQMPQTYLYTYNAFMLNPAYSGINNCTELSVAHHNQWIKIEGAPITNYLTVSTRLGRKLGVGGQFMFDKIGMLQQFSGLGNVSYGFLEGKHTLRLGLSLGYNNYRVNPNSALVFDPNDPIVNGGNQSAGSFTSDLGILYRKQELELFASVKQLLKTYSNFGYTNLPGYGQRPHLMVGAGYHITLSPQWGLRPNVLVKNINNVTQADVNADFDFKKFLHVGVGFRTSVGMIARAGILLKERFFFGYAYEAPMANMASYSTGSHEMMLRMTLCKPEKKTKTMAKVDTVRIETLRVDTVFITQIDTVVIENPSKGMETPNVPMGSLEKSILFEFDKALVRKESYGELQSLVNLLQVNPSLKLSLEGHTDAMGSESYNINLSKNRVNAVKDFLIYNGIPQERIIIEHHGETKPKQSNETTQGRQSNRRVDIRILE